MKTKRVPISVVKKANKDIGHYWFSPGAMRLFSSVISGHALERDGKYYFVSSEQFQPISEPYAWHRKYTARQVIDGEVKNLPGTESQQFDNWDDAWAAIHAYLKDR